MLSVSSNLIRRRLIAHTGVASVSCVLASSSQGTLIKSVAHSNAAFAARSRQKENTSIARRRASTAARSFSHALKVLGASVLSRVEMPEEAVNDPGYGVAGDMSAHRGMFEYGLDRATVCAMVTMLSSIEL
jgi:hypothetical protein